jgi:hypothetical protein
MTPEEINNTIEFLLKNAATFSVHMDELRLRQERDHQSLVELIKQTARFESWAAEVVTIESRRLDEHDRLHRDAAGFQKEALHLLHRILDKLPPVEGK